MPRCTEAVHLGSTVIHRKGTRYSSSLYPRRGATHSASFSLRWPAASKRAFFGQFPLPFRRSHILLHAYTAYFLIQLIQISMAFGDGAYILITNHTPPHSYANSLHPSLTRFSSSFPLDDGRLIQPDIVPRFEHGVCWLALSLYLYMYQ